MDSPLNIVCTLSSTSENLDSLCSQVRKVVCALKQSLHWQCCMRGLKQQCKLQITSCIPPCLRNRVRPLVSNPKGRHRVVWDGHIYGIGKNRLLGPLFWQSKHLEQKSKLQLGTIKNGFSMSDLPQMGPTKEHRGNLSNWSKSHFPHEDLRVTFTVGWIDVDVCDSADCVGSVWIFMIMLIFSVLVSSSSPCSCSCSVSCS